MEKKPPLSPAPQVFRIRFHDLCTLLSWSLQQATFRTSEKGWFVRSVNAMKIGCPSWPYLKICVCCWTRSLLIPFWVDQFSICYHHASVTTSVCVDGCASVKLLLYTMGADGDAHCGQQLLRWCIIYPRRSDPGPRPSRGRAPIYESDGYRRLSAGV